MQPRPTAETSRLLFPSLRPCIRSRSCICSSFVGKPSTAPTVTKIHPQNRLICAALPFYAWCVERTDAMKLWTSLAAGIMFALGARAAETPAFRDLFNGRDLSGWVNVNTAEDTWKVKDGLLICSGQPIGVMRSDKEYENFV